MIYLVPSPWKYALRSKALAEFWIAIIGKNIAQEKFDKIAAKKFSQ